MTAKNVTGSILTSDSITDYNTFENPDLVKPQVFTKAKVVNGQLDLDLPAKSIVVLEVE